MSSSASTPRSGERVALDAHFDAIDGLQRWPSDAGRSGPDVPYLMSSLDPAESPACAIPGALNRHSAAAAKIALFRSLFRGREDVYPRRFESRRTGKSGYAPACANEWVRGICEKPHIKCAVCPHRRFLPVTDDAIRWHLSGRDAATSRSWPASIRS